MKRNKLIATFASASAIALAGITVQQITQPTTQLVHAASYINSYIYNHGFSNPPINVRKTTFTDDFSYRYGRPEGVVVHETANDSSTIEGEVAYMQSAWSTNYAYVHAFVDHAQVIQIHPTNRGVWGAGPVANSRYIQIELVREHSTDAFARSVNNDAYYIAYLLKSYGLKPDLADNDGAGTVWSHNAVSKYLGGTDHSDPTGYFAKWGYDMNQFYELIQNKYAAINGSTQPPSNIDTSLAGKTSANGEPVATVQYNGNIAVFKQAGSQATGQYLAGGTKWKVFAQKPALGRTWYKVGGNQWIDGQYLYVTGTAKIPTEGNSTGNNEPSNGANMGQTANSGGPIAKVEYAHNIAVFKEAAKGATGQYLKPNTSWKVLGKKQALGRWWYQVGGNQWIDGQYLYVTGFNTIPTITDGNNNNSGSGTTVNFNAVGRVNYLPGYGILVWGSPAKTMTNKHLTTGTRWKIFKKTTLANGSVWYNLGGSQWVDGKYIVVE